MYKLPISTHSNNNVLDGKRPISREVDAELLLEGTPSEVISMFADIICETHISISVFEDGVRRSEKLKYNRMIAFDFDDGKLSTSDVEKLLNQYKLNFVISGSKRHLLLKNESGEPIEKFHVFIFLNRIITDPELYTFIWKKMAKLFGGDVDSNPKDVSRFFGKHSTTISTCYTNKFLPVEKFQTLYNKNVEEQRQKAKRISFIRNERIKLTMSQIDYTMEDFNEFMINRVLKEWCAFAIDKPGNGGDTITYKAAITIYNYNGTFDDFELGYGKFGSNVDKGWDTSSLQNKWKAAKAFVDKKGGPKLPIDIQHSILKYKKDNRGV